MQTTHKYLDPVTLSRIGSMELVARLVVEGFVTGLHKSPYQGFSVEFAEHRQYMPGDEIRYIDWKVFGKSDRYYIKKFEEETNLRAYILLDTSASMNFKHTDSSITKFEYGCYLTASLAYLMLKQRDSVGLALFDTDISEYIPPRGTPKHLRAIMNTLENATPGQETELSSLFHELAKRIVRRGLVIVISDLLDEPSQVISALKHLRHQKHEVIVFHLLDNAEINFPYNGSVIFRDMENGQTLSTQADSLKTDYLNGLNQFIQNYRRGCGSSQIDYVQIDTATPFDTALSAYLSRRK